MNKQKEPKDDLSYAATLLGKRSWQERLKRYGKRKLRAKLSEAGKAAARIGASGRPRLPDHKVKPASLYQRERRARLRAEAKMKRKERESI